MYSSILFSVEFDERENFKNANYDPTLKTRLPFQPSKNREYENNLVLSDFQFVFLNANGAERGGRA